MDIEEAIDRLTSKLQRRRREDKLAERLQERTMYVYPVGAGSVAVAEKQTRLDKLKQKETENET